MKHIFQPRGPRLACRRLESAPLMQAQAFESALQHATPVSLRQGWREFPQPEFRPAEVRVGWADGALFVYAVLDDDDIFNPETRFNEPSFKVGDVFEMFFRPVNQDAYYEFHVTPENQHFQLRIPSAAALEAARGRPGIPPEWVFPKPAFESNVEVDHARRRWRVCASIPLNQIEEAGPAPEWLFSFSRYDYTRGAEAPVLSSTSPHTRPRFHTQEDWGVLSFVQRSDR